MNKDLPTGVMGVDYAEEREIKRSLKYRLWRRTYEVLKAIREYGFDNIEDILDLGTADARMLDTIYKEYPKARCVGIEYAEDLVNFARNKFPYLEIINGDVQSLKFQDNSFDVVIATAILEHIPDPLATMREVYRVLKPGGIFIATTPVPFWEEVATFLGHLKDDLHYKTLTIKELRILAQKTNHEIQKTQKFMLSPIGLPCEFIIEKVFRFFHLDFLMANQLMVTKAIK